MMATRIKQSLLDGALGPTWGRQNKLGGKLGQSPDQVIAAPSLVTVQSPPGRGEGVRAMHIGRIANRRRSDGGFRAADDVDRSRRGRRTTAAAFRETSIPMGGEGAPSLGAPGRGQTESDVSSAVHS